MNAFAERATARDAWCGSDVFERHPSGAQFALRTGAIAEGEQQLDTYERVARDPSGVFHFHRGRDYAVERLGYDAPQLEKLPRIATDRFAGVGNPLAFRVLRPRGRLYLADVVVARELKLEVRQNPELWAACIAGALPETELPVLARDSGFIDVEIRAHFECFAGTDAEQKVSRDLRVRSVNFFARKPD